MAKLLGVEEWEKIVLNRACGMNNARNAEDVGRSTSAVTATLAAFDAVKERDWAKACNVITTYDCNMEVFQWAAKKTGTTIPAIVPQAYDKWVDDRRKKRLEALKQQETASAPQPSPDEMNTAKALVALLRTIEKQNELIESLLDVVIPKYVGDIKDNLNANFDVLNQTCKACEDKLEAVKIGIRKRGM